MNLLKLSEEEKSGLGEPRPLAVALGISEDRQDEIISRIDDMLKGKVPELILPNNDEGINVPLLLEAIENICENQNEYTMCLIAVGKYLQTKENPGLEMLAQLAMI